ncbi:MAG: Na+/H+ antiporter NhaA [Verrucomicrobia bacterium]|nr:Na+/H+ antiporter NhaA [Verrucomicrobiota bacterium]
MNALLLSEIATPIDRLVRPFLKFARLEAASGIVLFTAMLAALFWANSPWHESYTQVWATPLTLGVAPLRLTEPLLLWINDGLMTLFFFLVGLEIKREMLVGELASFKRAALPIMAAVGGMLVPAALYAAFNWRGPGAAGWGVPMATDIAFSLGVLSVLGRRVPFALKIFLTALAIADDIGAVLVIGLFYTSSISSTALFVAGGFLAALAVSNRCHVEQPIAYLLLSLGLWAAMLQSGVHATLAGVLIALCIPARTRVPRALPASDAGAAAPPQAAANGVALAAVPGPESGDDDWHAATTNGHSESLMLRLERLLHPWIGFGVMPLFALANAGVTITGDPWAVLRQPVSVGILAGLVVGKPLGILLLSWAAVRARVAALPTGVNWRHVAGVGLLGGIGFTMSLFIANLAFGQSALLDAAKVAILAASVISGLAGGLFLLTASRSSRRRSGTYVSSERLEDTSVRPELHGAVLRTKDQPDAKALLSPTSR